MMIDTQPTTTARAKVLSTDTLRLSAFGDWMMPLLLALCALSVVACSGGGGDSSSPTSLQSLTAASVEDQSFQLANQARQEAGVGQLTFDDKLSKIARKHSKAMRDRGFFAHVDPDGNGLRKRLKANGVEFSAAGENLALVNDSANPAGLAHQQLLTSPEHRDVMLAGRFVRAGVGVARSGDSFWITQIYLKP